MKEEVKKVRLTNVSSQLVTLYVWENPERTRLRILHLLKRRVVDIEPWEMSQYVYDQFVAGRINMEKLT
jgi:hypothetical protein